VQSYTHALKTSRAEKRRLLVYNPFFFTHLNMDNPGFFIHAVNWKGLHSAVCLEQRYHDLLTASVSVSTRSPFSEAAIPILQVRGENG
jgi:hypothetical protein